MTEYIYDIDGILEVYVTLTNAESSSGPELKYFNVKIENGQYISKEQRFNDGTILRLINTYENGNLVSQKQTSISVDGTESEISSVEFQYDDKINPFKGTGLGDLFNPKNNSANNVVRASSSELTGPIDYSYNYKARWPVDVAEAGNLIIGGQYEVKSSYLYE